MQVSTASIIEAPAPAAQVDLSTAFLHDPCIAGPCECRGGPRRTPGRPTADALTALWNRQQSGRTTEIVRDTWEIPGDNRASAIDSEHDAVRARCNDARERP